MLIILIKLRFVVKFYKVLLLLSMKFNPSTIIELDQFFVQIWALNSIDCTVKV